ncbi:tannase/feruloyl esterase family alpha/beta hydrolase [Streptomyces sp. NPDC102462]|uniref:tannase/feruloyl esterase family alpha/beta hydrolase n=1 Tax=Streptomyces sp. NPDC102462 TaxID=3366178 RepID=UPI00380DB150
MKRILAASGLAFTLVGGALAPSVHATPRTASCAELEGVKIPAAAIGMPTTGAEVTSARTVGASGDGPTAIGSYCQVDAAIHPVDPSAPDIEMRVALPDQWNNRAMMFGGGGYDGAIPDVTGNVPYGPGDRRTPLGRGYATFASDSGHQAAGGSSLDGSFGVNDEAVRNFAGDALKKTRDTAVFLLGRHYGVAKPAHSYFAGGSSGGREALAVAQRWPTDFDGVISAYPAWNAATLDLFFGYEAQVMSKPGAFPGPAQQALLYRSVISACDGGDGLRDGVVSDEAGCHFDPRTLRCPEDVESADTCLSDEQIRAIEAVSSPVRWKRLASGETGYPGIPYLSGANMATPVLGQGTQAPANPMPATSGYGVQFWEQWVKHFVTRDPAYNSLDVDPVHPGKWRQRISELSALQDVNDPDLSAFARAGGKLLLIHGTADEIVSYHSTVDYYKRVRKTVGGKATDRFARLYLVPGANHANFLPAYAASWDSVSALEDWTDQGKAPRHPVVTDANAANKGRTRPLCAYPTWPHYAGTGDPQSAASFTCRESSGRP